MQQHLYADFYSKGHNVFLGFVSASLIDKTDGFQPKKKENYWMRTLKTLGPLGLNVESVYLLDTCIITAILDWSVLKLSPLDTIVILYSFCFCVIPVTTISASFGGYRFIGFCVIWML